MKTANEIEAARLCDLTAEEIAHVALGLAHSFGCVLKGQVGSCVWYLRPEYSGTVALDARTLTVADVWRSAEKFAA